MKNKYIRKVILTTMVTTILSSTIIGCGVADKKQASERSWNNIK